MQVPYPIRRIWHDAIFQGAGRRSRYFEGWYIKMVSADTGAIFAVIPGVALGTSPEDHHAFVQVIDGKTAETAYHSFPFSEFRFSKTRFELSIGDNHFSENGIRLNLPGLKGDVQFGPLFPYPTAPLRPGIMDWYKFTPFMECYHGAVSLDHSLSGSLQAEGKTLSMDGGRGYIEKDWGRSFPSAWIWMQSNHFSQPGISFMMSVAIIPWLGSSFTGFLGFLLYGGKVLRFGTYSGARIRRISPHEHGVDLLIEHRSYKLEVRTWRAHAGILAAPVQGVMERRIAESVDARLTLKLYDKQGNVLFDDSCTAAGLEMVGEVDSLIARLRK